MSLLPALFKARKRPDDTAPTTEPADDSPRADSPPREAEDNVFELVPPEKIQEAVSRGSTRAGARSREKKGRNVHGLAAADLSRLSIDNDGRLYWDGKPVEVRRRIQMSRAQVVGASVVAAFVVDRRGRRGRSGLAGTAGLGLPARLDHQLLHPARPRAPLAPLIFRPEIPLSRALNPATSGTDQCATALNEADAARAARADSISGGGHEPTDFR